MKIDMSDIIFSIGIAMLITATIIKFCINR